MVLSAKVFWPLFPLLMLVVIVALTWALLYAVRRSKGTTTVWLQSAALGFYLLAAVAALAPSAWKVRMISAIGVSTSRDQCMTKPPARPIRYW